MERRRQLTLCRSGLRIQAAHWTNLLESRTGESLVELTESADGVYSVPLSMRGFEIKTLQLVLA